MFFYLNLSFENCGVGGQGVGQSRRVNVGSAQFQGQISFQLLPFD